MKSQISTKSLKALRAVLPSGAINTIAERLNLKQSAVSKALNGKTKNVNMKIVEEALKVVEEARAQAAEMENKIAALA
ncbi:MAG TPA: hypothetical protein VNQ80_15290 [Parapedobacter sp.]|uniref:hypothetical protein n=1 Tax=Parapedobacter sp. TaxID=1958893 RepID=UPI002BA97E6F|nr:hypothetical protein [Parapedobacter sp.]HWK58706.1 hypothetical protein [Parapedobacter sp.]